MGGALPVPSGILRKKGVPTTTAAGPFLPKGSVRPAAHILTREALHMGKTLVAYFSAGGVTRAVAERLAAAAGADLFEIRPAVPYTAADLDWTNKNSRSSVEMSNPGSRPEIAQRLEGMEGYDTVFVGFPIWWYVAPSIVRTFLESYDFSGKTLIPFATSGGSGLGKTLEQLKPLCPGALWKEGRMLTGASEQDIKNFLAAL